MNNETIAPVCEHLQAIWELQFPGDISIQAEQSATDALAVRTRHIDGTILWLTVSSVLPSQTQQALALLEKLAVVYEELTVSRTEAHRLTQELMVAWDRLSFLHKATLLMRDINNAFESGAQMVQLAQQTLAMDSAVFIYSSSPGAPLQHQWMGEPIAATYHKPLMALLDSSTISVRLSKPEQCKHAGIGPLQYFIGQKITVNGSVAAYIGLYNHVPGHLLTAGDIQIFESLAEQVTTVLKSRLLVQQQIEMQRINRELEIAGDVQSSFLPDTLPEIESYDLSALLIPADKIGGDFYDALPGYQRTVLLLCDVAGKGISAAILASEVRAAVRMELYEPYPIDEVISHVNTILHDDLENAERFATLMLVAYQPHKDNWAFANAGHTTGLLIRAGTLEVETLARTGLPLGIRRDETYTMGEFDMQPEDVLVLYSDGLSEAEDDHGRLFGMDGIIAVVRACHAAPTSVIQDVLLKAYRQHLSDNPITDDLTLMINKKSTEAVDTCPSFSWRFPSGLSEVAILQTTTDPILDHLPPGEASRRWLLELQLLLTEITSNIMRHSYEGRQDGIINGFIWCRDDMLHINITDTGQPYNPPANPPPLNIADLPEGGYGMHIIRNIADDLEYRRLSGGMNHWHLTRRLPTAGHLYTLEKS